MKSLLRIFRSHVFAVGFLLLLSAAAIADPLPSWNEGATKSSIVNFVDAVTDPDSGKFIPAGERIAVFDNDGTLWSEQPFYFQALFAMDIVAHQAELDPSVLTSDALKAAAEGDLAGMLSHGEHGLMEVIQASHSGMSIASFQEGARRWLFSTDHPSKKRPYATLAFQPMLELLGYLRDRGFKTYIVSGGGADFMRAFAEDVYGIPPDQVIGSIGNHYYVVNDAHPEIRKAGGIFFIDDKGGKPIGIMRHIGKRPIFAAGNSDGDFEMLEWVTAGEGSRFALIVHHTDAEREWAYDRDSAVGRLARGLDETPRRGWTIVDMKRDWSRVYP